MRNTGQPTAQQYQDFPAFSDQLEAVISDLECQLLATLAPDQFVLVQRLVEANLLLAECERLAGQDLIAVRKSA